MHTFINMSSNLAARDERQRFGCGVQLELYLKSFTWFWRSGYGGKFLGKKKSPGSFMYMLQGRIQDLAMGGAKAFLAKRVIYTSEVRMYMSKAI